MPILLDTTNAPVLQRLLDETDTSGLTWTIEPGGAQALPPGEIRVAGIANLERAGPQEISFVANPRYQSQLTDARAAAVLVTPEVAQAYRESLREAGRLDHALTLVVCNSPYLMFARIGQWFDKQIHPQPPGSIHPSAVVDPGAEVDPSAHVGPLAVIEKGAQVGPRARIGAGCYVGEGCRIGADSVLHPRVTLYRGVVMGARCIILSGAVIGEDGFGFAPDPSRAKGAWCKIPQFGGVRIGDDVEIGANTTIDRGALDDTVIGNGVKIDNQIMIGHNCQIGDHTAMAACVGIAGSTTIGQRCSIGGAAMIGGHLKIGDDVFISAATPVHSNIDKPGQYTGFFPMTEHAQWERNAVAVRHLATMAKRIKALEKK
ncbi:UDP-3-O-(3-hydroxymyristoyl)glucosamine N-acyltransferase [Pigmentiphaga sp.]|jgi:UDP-3-O-[3-hydroxymyristoyl] glucosamine N-acyltransferase|uniref:UDP-3-O-(3-hydroxymyristoyl)glucosamine N-acyltransferase n=1 Tax=Pigmentiphaga sp. TaxID=1977564 RepID=UPI0025FB04A2|nr:UDP-3-O-(3-hydroxymyristoyl)glucosamine N-acyltransferase [Pigmentiphaga sp.]MBX6317528.1 UDP-3-O-(3-hydroxymyristoyl)glucosamine N-acyltransferase [Pigmentiphaga sp.]